MAEPEQRGLHHMERAQGSMSAIRALLDQTEQALGSGRLSDATFHPGDRPNPAELTYVLDQMRAMMMCW